MDMANDWICSGYLDTYQRDDTQKFKSILILQDTTPYHGLNLPYASETVWELVKPRVQD